MYKCIGIYRVFVQPSLRVRNYTFMNINTSNLHYIIIMYVHCTYISCKTMMLVPINRYIINLYYVGYINVLLLLIKIDTTTIFWKIVAFYLFYHREL